MTTTRAQQRRRATRRMRLRRTIAVVIAVAVVAGGVTVFAVARGSSSPPLADYIAGHDSLRFVVRLVLWPLIAFAWCSLHLSVGTQLLLVALAGLLFRRRIARALRRRLRAEAGGAA